VTPWAASLAALCVGLLLACGKYGPPVRASEAQQPETKRSFEIPLPSASEPEPEPAAPAAPPGEPAPPSEEEPPPEGAP
jgi:hypothetical protein